MRPKRPVDSPPPSGTQDPSNAPHPIEPRDLPPGIVHVSEPLADLTARLALAGIDPLLKLDDWATYLACSRREVERMKSSGKLPPPDLHVGKMPRWRVATVRRWVDEGGKR